MVDASLLSSLNIERDKNGGVICMKEADANWLM
jgi:hypothetical protein